jgi:tRNA-specific 2-thiouridylase
MSAIRPNWTNQPPGAEWSGEVQVRAHGSPMGATVHTYDPGLEVVLDTATNGVAPGQAVVLYEGSQVIGSATISTTRA